MKKTFIPVAVAAAVLVGTAGCVDDKYDLKDIDQTVKVEVKDLIVPLNVDKLTLSTLFDLDEENPDATVKVVNGVYAIQKKGSFSSKGVSIDYIRLNGVSGEPTESEIVTGVSTVPAGVKVSLPVKSEPIDFEYTSNSVPAEIVSIDRIGGGFDFYINLELMQLQGVVKKFTLRNLVFDLPKGFSATSAQGTYNPETGKFTVPELTANSNRVQILLHGTGVDYAAAGGAYDHATHTASYKGTVTLGSGTIEFDGADINGSLPAVIKMQHSLGVSSLIVDKFTGRVTYAIKDVDINPVLLNDLPDILAQEDTRVKIMNPQIYLGVDNPVAPYGLSARTGFCIVSSYPSDRPSPSVTAELDAPGYFTIGDEAHSEYLLSPENVSTPAEGFTNPVHVPYSSLSDVLLGNGLPSTLDISLTEPMIPEQAVTEFPLGTTIGDMAGNYTFFAPIALGGGSQVVYTDTQDGWNDEDLDAVTITTLEIAMDVTSNCPFSLNLSGYPIGTDGKQIGNVEIAGAEIAANAQNQHVVICVTGTVKSLDGFVYTAKGFVPQDMQNALSPDQNMTLDNIRVKVSGTYIKDLGE